MFQNPKTIGKRFDCKYVDDWERVGNQFIFDLPYPDHAHFPESPSKFIDLHTEAAPEPVFVTAFNNPFFRNGERLVGQNFFDLLIIKYRLISDLIDSKTRFSQQNRFVRLGDFKGAFGGFEECE